MFKTYGKGLYDTWKTAKNQIRVSVFYFQMPEFIMKIFNYLHTPLPASVSCLLNMPDL
jgi:hypothetical protein